jgi:hypothetical protein
MSIFLPSIQEQLANAREAVDSGIVCAHIDTCHAGYLNDHHNRDNELLLGVFVDGHSTIADVKEALLEEFRAIAFEIGENKPGYDHDKALAAIHTAFSDINPVELHRTAFDDSLDVTDEEDAEYCQAWFVLSWDEPDSDEGEAPSD